MPHQSHSTAAAGGGALLALLAGCSGGGDSTPSGPDIADEGATPPTGFQFSTSESVAVDLLVRLDGVPVEGAVVQLVDVLDFSNLETLETASLGGTFFAGTSNSSGEVVSTVSVPLDRDSVDLVVDLAGAEGPYDDEGLRAHWGLFAPASRTTVTRADFSGLLMIDLTSL